MMVWHLSASGWVTLQLLLSALLNQGNTLGLRMFGVSNAIYLVILRRLWVAALRWAAGDICRSRGCQVFF